MRNVKVQGKITEITWLSETTCKFIIDDGESEIQGIIVKSKYSLADKISVGAEYEFVGDIVVYRNPKPDTTYVENAFYIMDIKEIEE